MAHPFSPDPDVEAQLNSVSEIWPMVINPPPNLPPPPSIDTAPPKLPISADPQPQATDAHQHHIGNPPALVIHKSCGVRSPCCLISCNLTRVPDEKHALLGWAVVDVPHRGREAGHRSN